MAKELKLEPGWLIKDVRKAAEKLTEWANAGVSQPPVSSSRNDQDLSSDNGGDQIRPPDESC